MVLSGRGFGGREGEHEANNHCIRQSNGLVFAYLGRTSDSPLPMHKQAYKKPPVVEVICELSFEGSQGKPPWSAEIAKTFLQRAVPEQLQLEVLPEKVEFTPEGFRFQEIARMRAREKSGGCAVQVGNDFLACHVLRTKEPYSFAKLCELVDKVLPIYYEVFCPNRVVRMGLWYVDFITIPEPNPSLDDYFRIGVRLPRPDATVTTFDFRVVLDLDTATHKKFLDLHVQDASASAQDGCKFRIDWHLVEDLAEETSVRTWLGNANDVLYSWFEESLTPKCLKLFEPIGEGE
jgi:uncharacterized protein (TIGR04255 family)